MNKHFKHMTNITKSTLLKTKQTRAINNEQTL